MPVEDDPSQALPCPVLPSTLSPTTASPSSSLLNPDGSPSLQRDLARLIVSRLIWAERPNPLFPRDGELLRPVPSEFLVTSFHPPPPSVPSTSSFSAFPTPMTNEASRHPAVRKALDPKDLAKMLAQELDRRDSTQILAGLIGIRNSSDCQTKQDLGPFRWKAGKRDDPQIHPGLVAVKKKNSKDQTKAVLACLRGWGYLAAAADEQALKDAQVALSYTNINPDPNILNPNILSPNVREGQAFVWANARMLKAYSHVTRALRELLYRIWIDFGSEIQGLLEERVGDGWKRLGGRREDLDEEAGLEDEDDEREEKKEEEEEEEEEQQKGWEEECKAQNLEVAWNAFEKKEKGADWKKIILKAAITALAPREKKKAAIRSKALLVKEAKTYTHTGFPLSNVALLIAREYFGTTGGKREDAWYCRHDDDEDDDGKTTDGDSKEGDDPSLNELNKFATDLTWALKKKLRIVTQDIPITANLADWKSGLYAFSKPSTALWSCSVSEKLPLMPTTTPGPSNQQVCVQTAEKKPPYLASFSPSDSSSSDASSSDFSDFSPEVSLSTLASWHAPSFHEQGPLPIGFLDPESTLSSDPKQVSYNFLFEKKLFPCTSKDLFDAAKWLLDVSRSLRPATPSLRVSEKEDEALRSTFDSPLSMGWREMERDVEAVLGWIQDVVPKKARRALARHDGLDLDRIAAKAEQRRLPPFLRPRKKNHYFEAYMMKRVNALCPGLPKSVRRVLVRQWNANDLELLLQNPVALAAQAEEYLQILDSGDAKGRAKLKGHAPQPLDWDEMKLLAGAPVDPEKVECDSANSADIQSSQSGDKALKKYDSAVPPTRLGFSDAAIGLVLERRQRRRQQRLALMAKKETLEENDENTLICDESDSAGRDLLCIIEDRMIHKDALVGEWDNRIPTTAEMLRELIAAAKERAIMEVGGKKQWEGEEGEGEKKGSEIKCSHAEARATEEIVTRKSLIKSLSVILGNVFDNNKM